MLVKACLNGGVSPDKHLAVPRSASELAADAIAVVKAGAGAIHFHPRDESDPDAPETLDSAWVLPQVAAVHAAVPGIPVGVTTGLWAAGGDVSRRLEFVADWNGPDRPDFASLNLSEPGVEELAALLDDLDIPIEAGIWTLADVDALVAASFGRRVLRVLVEVQDPEPADAAAHARAIDDALVAYGFTAPQVHHGYGMATWAVLRSAIADGRDVRIGLEDTTVLPDGSPAAGNAELVAVAIGLARGDTVVLAPHGPVV